MLKLQFQGIGEVSLLLSSPFLIWPSLLSIFMCYSELVKFTGAFDPELRSVLELATDSELYELERILFGPR